MVQYYCEELQLLYKATGSVISIYVVTFSQFINKEELKHAYINNNNKMCVCWCKNMTINKTIILVLGIHWRLKSISLQYVTLSLVINPPLPVLVKSALTFTSFTSYCTTLVSVRRKEKPYRHYLHLGELSKW